MKILGLAANHPERKVSNRDVLRIVQQKSEAGFQGDLPATLMEVEKTLDSSGIQNRYWFEKDEPWYPLMKKTMDRALEQSGLSKDDIDLVIYSSVFRRVLEPGMSTLIASAYGLHKAECFDVIEACAGWLRGMHVAQNFIKGGAYKNIMILNAEAGVHEGEYGFETFGIKKPEDLEWSYSSLTLGEAVAATVVSAGGEDLSFSWRSFPQFATLCSLGLPDTTPAGNMLGDIDLGSGDSKKFKCHAREMNAVGFKRCYKLIDETRDEWLKADAIIPHSHSKETFERLFSKAGSKSPLISVYANYGNVASCSFPLSIMDGLKTGILSDGSKVFFMMTAAGLSMGAVSLTFNKEF